MESDVSETDDAPDIAALPDWCDVDRGLSDEEVEELERIIVTRADLSRDVP